MYYGDVVDVSRKGVRVQPSALFPLGVGDGSRCWGVWLERPESAIARHSFDQLIVSPIPPDAWPVCFRLQVILRDGIGTLADASKVLELCGVNVLSTDSVPGGFNHAIWNITCTSLPLKTWAEEQRAHLFRANRRATRAEIRALILRIALRQFIFVSHVQWVIRACGARLSADGENGELLDQIVKSGLTDRSPDAIARLSEIVAAVRHQIDSNSAPDDREMRQGFLDNRFFYGRKLLLSWEGEILDQALEDPELLDEVELFGDFLPLLCDRRDRVPQERFRGASPEARVKLLAEIMRAEFLHIRSRAVDGNMCPTLLGTWCEIAHASPIFQFQYDAKDELLRYAGSTIETRAFGDRTGLKPPTKATASFSLQEPFIRIIPLQDKYRSRRYRAEIRYEVRYAQRSEGQVRSSSGLMHQVAQAFRSNGFQLVRISNRLTERPGRLESGGTNEERGRFVCSVIAPAGARVTDLDSPIRQSLKQIRTIASPSVQHVEITPRLSRETVDRLFISHRHDGQFWKPEKRERVERLCRDAGFQPVFGQAGGKAITSSVIESLESSSAFLQIIHISSDEKFRGVDMTWMIAEYAMARMAKLPHRRALQKENRSKPRGAAWRERLKLDSEVPFEEWWSDSLYDTVLPKLLDELRTEADRSHR